MISRAEFEKYRLIYIPAEQVWVSPSSCVWGEDPGIGRIYGVSAVYPDLADLFMDTLLIKEPTIATYIEELRHLIAKPFPRDIASIKGAIKCISNLDPTIEDLDELLNLSCLPVHVPGSSTIKLMKPSDKFFIADRREYEQVFKEKVPVLDFLLEEIYYLWPFIEALELTDRYMSVAVQEKTGVQQSSEALSKSLSQDFRAKAGALYRYVILC